MPTRDTALAAYDHVAALLIAGGDDTGVTREQVHEVVAGLRKEGRGTEALAANSLFTMVNHIDHEKQEHITTTHLDRARAYFARKIFARGGAITPSEVTQLPPTLRALLEIGEFQASTNQPGRIAHRIPRQGMDHTAAILRALARPDDAITRADRDLAIYELYEQGRGTEALAVRFFFNFIDHRHGRILEQITVQEIEDAVKYSDLRLLRKKDTDNNGYSRDEVAKFSTTARAFLRVGQMIEAGLVTAQA
ncbi:MAG: hypothetical protein ACI8RZ_003079 [Myxococcota bacterium]|jgi:hypothetical protein